MPAFIDLQSIRLRKWSPDSTDSPDSPDQNTSLHESQSATQTQTHSPWIVASHMYGFLDPEKLREHIEFALRALEGWIDKFDAIAFRGMSGALIAPPVALALGKSLILVRKPGDKTHSDYRVEGDYNARSYVILDDFISTGTTQLEIRKVLSSYIPNATFIGVLEVSYITPGLLSYYKEYYGRYRLAFMSIADQEYFGAVEEKQPWKLASALQCLQPKKY